MADKNPPAEASKPARKSPAKPRVKRPAAAAEQASELAAEPEGASMARRSRKFSLARLRFWAQRAALGVVAFFLFVILLFAIVPPPINVYQMSESFRLGGIEKDWVSFDEIAPVMARSAVAAEDVNFCSHWGFDMAAIRQALETGGSRGGSTISQQVVKNVFLWHGRSWLRKAMEAALTPVVEILWSKERILEVYLNVAEFDEGVFGVQAAARHYFGVDAKNLSALQAARLAAILPDPKGRSASNPSDFVRKRTRAIISGAETIARDSRSACFKL